VLYSQKIEWAMGQEYNEKKFVSTHQPSCMLWWVLGSRWPIYTTNFSPFIFFMHTDLEDLHSRIWNLHSICINNRSRLHNCRLLLSLLPTCSFNKKKASHVPFLPSTHSPNPLLPFQNEILSKLGDPLSSKLTMRL
jgi:hypothetical protein